jgi:hypothetical protein
VSLTVELDPVVESGVNFCVITMDLDPVVKIEVNFCVINFGSRFCGEKRG